MWRELRSTCHLGILLIVWLVTNAICSDQGKAQPNDFDNLLHQLRNSTGSTSEETAQRTAALKALRRSVFPEEVFAIIGEQLRNKNVAVILDIVETDGLWSEEFAAPLLAIFSVDKRELVREKVLESFSRHRRLHGHERSSLLAGLRQSGELDAFLSRPSAEFIELLTKIGDPAAIRILTGLVQNTDSVPSGIGLSQPLPALPPRIRICDCAHDAIIRLCGESLDVRVAIAYQALDFTNQFDSRSVNLAPAFTIDGVLDPRNIKGQEPEDAHVVDESAENSRLYEEVRRVRNKMIENLASELLRAGLHESSAP